MIDKFRHIQKIMKHGGKGIIAKNNNISFQNTKTKYLLQPLNRCYINLHIYNYFRNYIWLFCSRFINCQNMKQGDIVFAPYKDTMWPGRIQYIGRLTNIRFYKIKEQFKVQKDSLVPFTPQNISLFQTNNQSKTFATAVKIAEVELKKQQKRDSQDSSSCRSWSKSSRGKSKGKRIQQKVLPSLRENCSIENERGTDYSRQKVVKKQQECKNEQNSLSKIEEDKEMPEFNNIIQYLLAYSNQQLQQLANDSIPHQFEYIQKDTKEKIKIVSVPKLQMHKLAEWMLFRLLSEKKSHHFSSYQHKVVTLLNTINFNFVSWNRDLFKLVAKVIEQYDRGCLAWKNHDFVEFLRSFQKQIWEKTNATLEDVNKISESVDLIRRFQIKSIRASTSMV